MRVFLPATLGLLHQLVADEEFRPVGGTAFALTPALRESYASGDTEDMEYIAMLDAARASLRLLAADLSENPEALPRRAVIAADVDDVKLRPDLDYSVVKVPGTVTMKMIASVHVDTADAEPAVRAASAVVDAADLGDPDAEFTVGSAEDHALAWYAPQELPFLLELM